MLIKSNSIEAIPGSRTMFSITSIGVPSGKSDARKQSVEEDSTTNHLREHSNGKYSK